MKYYYLVMWACQFGSGRTEVYRKSKIETKTQFLKLEEYVKEQNSNVQNLYIINLILFKNK